MKKPSIENIIKHNKRIIDNPSNVILANSEGANYNRAMGWYQALIYITNNYNIEEK